MTVLCLNAAVGWSPADTVLLALSIFLHWKLRFHPSVLAQGIMRGSNFGIGHGFHSILRDIAEKKTDRRLFHSSASERWRAFHCCTTLPRHHSALERSIVWI